MSSDTTNPRLRGYADALIGLEDTINYILQMAAMDGVLMRLEAEVVNQPHLSSRIHLRVVTPDMEVRDDLPTKPRKAPVRSTAGEESR